MKVKDKASQFTVPQKLGLAYTFGSTSAVARQWRCDNNTVHRLQMEVAQTFLRTQSRVLELARKCLETRGGLLWVVCLTKWDETSEELSLRVCSCASLQQQRSSWHVMVVRMKLAWGFEGGLVQCALFCCLWLRLQSIFTLL